MTSVRFLPEAREDIRRKKRYYRRIDSALAERFQTEVERAVHAVAGQPLAMQTLASETRRWPLQVFSHGLLYRVESDHLLVLAMFHPSQAPERWQGRVPE